MSKLQWLTLVAVIAVLTFPVAWDLGVRGLHRFPADPVQFVAHGDARLGREQIVHYGCGACHVIPGVRNANGRVGPRLTGFKEQMYVAGVLTNRPRNLIAWIENPRDVVPQTAMPNLGVTTEEARNIAAYLYQMR